MSDLESPETLAVRCGHNLDALVVAIRERDAAITEREREDVRRILRNVLEVVDHALAELGPEEGEVDRG